MRLSWRGARVVIALVLCANAAVVFSPKPWHGPSSSGTPLRALDELFLLGHMFAGYLPDNTQIVLEGRRAGDGQDGRWITLDTRDFFADGPPGEHVTRLYAIRQRWLDGAPAQRAAWRDLARQIVRRQSTLHPDAAIDRVRFGAHAWPKSPDGWDAARRPGLVRYQRWYEGPNAEEARP